MKRQTCFLCTFAAVLLSVQAAFWLGPKAERSALEKRVLAEPPKLTPGRVADGRWMEQAENYLSDHFPARDALVGINAYLRQGAGLNAAGEIYRGQDGWLLAAPLNPDTQILERNLDAIAAFTQRCGLPASLLAVPSAGAVEMDQLPALHDTYPDAALLEYITEQLDGILQIPDLLTAFTQAENRTALYYRTDHHWTSAGAYMGYRAYCAAMGEEAVDQRAFIVTQSPGFYGTSYAKSGLWATPPDTLTLWEDETLETQVTIWDDNKPAPTQQQGLFFRTHLEEPDQYPVFLDGNHGRVRITTNRPGGRLLIVRDSFAHCLAPFLAEQYSQIDLLDLRYFKKQSVSEYLAEYPADAVLFCYGLDSLTTDKNIAQLQ